MWDLISTQSQCPAYRPQGNAKHELESPIYGMMSKSSRKLKGDLLSYNNGNFATVVSFEEIKLLSATPSNEVVEELRFNWQRHKREEREGAHRISHSGEENETMAKGCQVLASSG